MALLRHVKTDLYGFNSPGEIENATKTAKKVEVFLILGLAEIQFSDAFAIGGILKPGLYVIRV